MEGSNLRPTMKDIMLHYIQMYVGLTTWKQSPNLLFKGCMLLVEPGIEHIGVDIFGGKRRIKCKYRRIPSTGCSHKNLTISRASPSSLHLRCPRRADEPGVNLFIPFSLGSDENGCGYDAETSRCFILHDTAGSNIRIGRYFVPVIGRFFVPVMQHNSWDTLVHTSE